MWFQNGNLTIMIKLIIALFLSLSSASQIKAQEMDSTLAIFFNEEFGKSPVIKENGKQIIVWVGESNKMLSGNLIILSDSTILVGSDSVSLLSINATTKAKKNRVAAGIIAMLGGATSAGLGVLLFVELNKFVDNNLFLFLIALPVYAIAGGLVAGGTLAAGVGTVTLVSGAPTKVRLKAPPVVKYKFNM